MDRIAKGAEWLMTHKKWVGYALIAFFFAVLAQQLYNRFVKSSSNSSYYEGYSNTPGSGADNAPSVATIRMFKVGWCPHCKNSEPIFKAFQDKYHGNIVNGCKMIVVSVDGEDPNNESLVNEFKIQGYPTIVLTKDGKNIEYDAKVDEPTLEKFINTMV
jgi:thiol-disulfide isomerase/thioredoxin